jgi:hypothetical protein
MYAGMTRRVFNRRLTQYTDSTQFGISNDNFKAADSSSAGAGASTAPATTTASVNIKTPISAQAVSASDAVTSAASSAASVIASASSSAASVISSASSAISSAAVSCLCFPYISTYLTFSLVLSFFRGIQQTQLCHWSRIQCRLQRCQLHEHSHKICQQLCIFSFKIRF